MRTAGISDAAKRMISSARQPCSFPEEGRPAERRGTVGARLRSRSARNTEEIMRIKNQRNEETHIFPGFRRGPRGLVESGWRPNPSPIAHILPQRWQTRWGSREEEPSGRRRRRRRESRTRDTWREDQADVVANYCRNCARTHQDIRYASSGGKERGESDTVIFFPLLKMRWR